MKTTPTPSPSIAQGQDPHAMAKLRELIDDISIAMIVTVTPEGSLRGRPMMTQESDEAGELWFLTSDETSASRDVIDEHLVNVSYADPERQRYVSVSGRAVILHDPARQEKLWRPEFERYFPRGLADPHLALLRVRIEAAEYWDVTAGRMRPVHEHRGTGGAADEAGDSEARAERGGAAGGGGGDEHAKVDLRPLRRPR